MTRRLGFDAHLDALLREAEAKHAPAPASTDPFVPPEGLASFDEYERGPVVTGILAETRVQTFDGVGVLVENDYGGVLYLDAPAVSNGPVLKWWEHALLVARGHLGEGW